ncbi:MAG: hypothetical protein EXR18_08240 [Flavobacteriaceae bacterium]|nr:hypothetical protein [Flavobacteriaceae bacterium]
MQLNKFLSFLFILISSFFVAQKSETLIPKDAVTVFSINNINLLQKISIDELISYEFMEEIHQELFDGSTSGKTLKDAGLDFDQKLNIFYGKLDKCELSGFTFGIKNQEQLFTVFDDFEAVSYPNLNGAVVYESFFNNLIVKNGAALLIRVEPSMEHIDEVADSIWYARGNENPYDYIIENEDESVLNEKIYDENTQIENSFPDATLDPNEKNYNELRDSVQLVLQREQLEKILNQLFIENVNLMRFDSRFEAQLLHPVEGVFYMDNARNIDKSSGLWYFQTVLPSLYKNIQELYAGNLILGDLRLKDKSVEFAIEVLYGEKLGSIYMEMNDSYFDKQVLKYIPESSSGFFTYNINLRKAYEKAFEVIMPLLEQEKNAQVAMNVLTIELLNEFVNKDALFGTYKGSMFGSFNGIKKIKTKKIEFFYDEDTFEYGEREADAEEDMPIVTIGFSIERNDIPEKVLKHLARLTSKVKNMGDYWRFDNAIFDSAPLYMINKNGLFIFSNDEDLALNHVLGYGANSINNIKFKNAKKSGFMYAHLDVKTTLIRFPKDLLSPNQNEMIESLRGKSGSIELKSSKTSKEKTSLNLSYSFSGNEQTGKHLLDLINTIYVVSK